MLNLGHAPSRSLESYCNEIGRDPDSLDRSLYYWVPKSDADPWVSEQAFQDVLGPYVEAGVNQFILDQPRDDQLDVLTRVATHVLPKYANEKPRALEAVRSGEIDTSSWRKPVDHL
jgi:hypothetical protein